MFKGKQLMKNILLSLTGLLLVSFMGGCEKRSNSDLSKVHWDRDMCARCVMVVSDRVNAVQVKHPETGKSYMFDDIGCMVLWFKEENIQWQDSAIIWITDNKTGEWIDARKAHYHTSKITPMAYGFGAHKTKESIQECKDIVDYNEVVKRVLIRGK